MNHQPRPTRNPSTQRALIIGVATAASALIVLATSAVATRAQAQTPNVHVEPIIYPARGQLPAEQSRDRYECYEWSKRQTGFDPAQSPGYASHPPASAQAPAQSSSMNTASAMIGGAAGGAAIAELTHHDVGRGAAIGVLGGGLVAQAKAQQQQAQMKQQQAAQAQAAQSATARQRSAYDRALGACMEARGYTVR